jgi:hypothetical protein
MRSEARFRDVCEPTGIHRITRDNLDLMEGLLGLFGEIFDARETYDSARPTAEYQ